MVDYNPQPRTHKTCAKCGAWLLFEHFRRSRTSLSGLTSWCRDCMNANNRAWRAANPDYIDAYNKARRTPPTLHQCSECSAPFYGRKDRKTCSPACRSKRKVRTDPRWH